MRPRCSSMGAQYKCFSYSYSYNYYSYSYSYSYFSVKFTEDRVLVFVILREKC